MRNSVTSSSAEVMKLLIDKGGEVNGIFYDGNSNLITSARNKEPEKVKILLEAGADVHHKNDAGFDALYYASPTYNKEVRELLLQYGAVEK